MSLLSKSNPPPDNPTRAAIYMLLAAVTLPAINACAKYLSSYPVIEITWARYAGHFLFMIAVFAPTHGLAMLRSTRPGLQLLRSSLHCASAFLTFTALAYVALPTATAISFTAPLMVTALAPSLLGEKLGLDRGIAVVTGFLGALIIVRPGFSDQTFALVLLLLNALCSANIQIMSRMLAGYDKALTSNTYMVVVGFVLMSLPLPFVWQNPANWTDILVFCAIGIFGGAGHYFLVSAFEQAPASFVAPFNYGQIVGAATFGYFIFGQLPDMWTWIGAAIIAASSLYVLLRERRRRS